MNGKPRRWDLLADEDPAAGLLNLFDVWIAFSVALLLALFSYLHAAPPAGPAPAVGETAAALRMDVLKDPVQVPHFRPTRAALTGQGMRLGTAYRLASGDIVYVPDAPPADSNP